MSDVQTVTVSILDREYQVNCGPDEVATLRKSAEYLDTKMREIKGNSSVHGLDRIAVMAALNISAEYLTAEDKAEQSKSTIASQETQVDQLNLKLDAAINRLKSSESS